MYLQPALKVNCGEQDSIATTLTGTVNAGISKGFGSLGMSGSLSVRKDLKVDLSSKYGKGYEKWKNVVEFDIDKETYEEWGSPTSPPVPYWDPYNIGKPPRHQGRLVKKTRYKNPEVTISKEMVDSDMECCFDTQAEWDKAKSDPNSPCCESSSSD